MTSASLCAAAFFTMHVIRSSESLHECQAWGIVAWMLITGMATYGFVRALGSLIRAARGDAKLQPQFEYHPGPWELPEGVSDRRCSSRRSPMKSALQMAINVCDRIFRMAVVAYMGFAVVLMVLGGGVIIFVGIAGPLIPRRLSNLSGILPCCFAAGLLFTGFGIHTGYNLVKNFRKYVPRSDPESA